MATSDAFIALVGRPLTLLAHVRRFGGPSYWLRLLDARAAAARGEWAKAIAEYEALLANRPADVLSLRGLEGAALRAARQAQECGRWLDACRMWLKFAEASAETDKSIKNLSYCARRITHGAETPEQISEALSAWRCLTELAPDSREARNGLEWCLLNLLRFAEQASDTDAARRYSSELLALPPGEGRAQLGALPSGKHEARAAKSEAEFKRRIAAALGRADSARDRGAWADAAKYYRAVLELDPGAAAIWVQLGHVLKELDHIGDARSAYERAASLEPDDPEIHLQLGHLLKLARKKRQAIQAYSRALELNPTFKNARRELEQLGEKSHADAIVAKATLSRNGRRAAPKSSHARSSSITNGRAAADVSFLWSRCEPYLVAAEQHARARDVDNCLRALTEFRAAAASVKEHIYSLARERLSQVVEMLIAEVGDRHEFRERLAQFVVSWLSDRARRDFVVDNFGELFADVAAAARLRTAPANSRLERLRNCLFEHDFERYRSGDPDSLASDPNLCRAALGYFRQLSQSLPPDSVPLPSWVADRLTRNALSLEAGQSLTALMTYALMTETPPVELSSPSFFDAFGAWYLLNFVPDRHIPSTCIGSDIVEYFNTVAVHHKTLGICVTRFLQAFWGKSDVYRSAYDLSTPLDSLLLSLEVIGTSLPDSPQHRHFLREIVFNTAAGEMSFAEECIRALAGGDTAGTRFGEDLLAAIGGTLEPAEAKFFTEEHGPQDVLLIGHAGKGTGLGRNFEMLRDALQMGDIALEHLDHDLNANVFGEALEEWAGRCRSRPIVVLAVNAQDVPTIFVKDRSGILRDVYVVGFLLWETSDVPRVQRLGLGLIDEAWTPTQYVADIYAPFVPTHLVGKALWDDARSPMPGTRTGARSPFTFLTVFDFHSSIERKNPLAVALAFQRAFRPDENVRLIIKTSNVNPAHWSNALGHWEKLSRVWIADNRINVVNARYSDAQMLALMEETSCFVSLHRSEGFGYVIADAMLQEIPVVATNYSGNVDFCTNETYFPVSYTLQPVDERVMHWKAEKAEWADPDIDSAAVQMRHVFDHYDEALAVARRAREHILARYNMPSFRAALRRRIEEIANRHAHREEISADLEKVAAPALPVREI